MIGLKHAIWLETVRLLRLGAPLYGQKEIESAMARWIHGQEWAKHVRYEFE